MSLTHKNVAQEGDYTYTVMARKAGTGTNMSHNLRRVAQLADRTAGTHLALKAAGPAGQKDSGHTFGT